MRLDPMTRNSLPPLCLVLLVAACGSRGSTQASSGGNKTWAGGSGGNATGGAIGGSGGRSTAGSGGGAIAGTGGTTLNASGGGVTGGAGGSVTAGTGGTTLNASGSSVTGGAGGGATGGSAGSAMGGLGGTASGGAGGAGNGGTTSPSSGQGGTTSTLPPSMCYSFDQSAGALSVDWPAFLSQYDLVYTKPVTASGPSDSPGNGIPFGNGRVGAMIWNPDNGIKMQLTHVDASPVTQMSEGLVVFKTTPSLADSSSPFKQRLNLYDGTVTITYGTDRTVTIFGKPDSDLIGMHVHDARANVSSATLDLNFWGGNPPWKDLTMGVNLKNPTTWSTIDTATTADTVSFNRAQADPDNYGYTLAATVDGTTATTSKPDNLTVRLTIKPATDYTIWIAVATRKWAANGDSKAAATSILSDAKTSGYDAILKANKDYWHQTWTKSMAQYAGSGETDYLLSLYYISMYLFGGGARGKAPFHFITGVYRWAGDSDIHWNVGYWIWNQRPFYNSFFASNHADWVNPWVGLYADKLAVNVQQTLSEYKIPGAVVPETMDQDGGPHLSDFTHHVFSSGLEIAFNMYDKYRYTNDTEYVKSTAYKYMKTVVDFYMAYAKKSGSTYYFEPSNSHETFWNVKNPITDLSVLRVALPRLIEMQKITGSDPDMPAKWQEFLTNLSPLPTASGKYAPCDPPSGGGHNSENPELEPVWPYGLIGLGSNGSDLDMAKASWTARANKDNNVWSPDAPQAVRLGLAENAYTSLKALVARNQSLASGIGEDGNGRFEPNGLVMSTINESLVQSYDGTIRVFPALPAAATTARFTLLTTGGFLVSSESLQGKIPYVGIKSLYGKHAVMANPWGTAAVQVRAVSDGKTVTSGSTAKIEFDTIAGATYVVEQTSDPCTGHDGKAIGGTPNTAPRQLGTRRLGL
jgi:alpha-L-fucosidase 2